MRNSTGNRTENGRNKRRGIATVLVALFSGLCTAALTVRAQEPEQVVEARQTVVRTGLSSQGSLVYEGNDMGARIYAADFLLLKDRMGTIPDTVFEPGSYTQPYSLEPSFAYDTHACGYQTQQEEAHTLFFEAVDATVHQSRCRMEGTGLCPGYEPVVEEHYAYFYEPCEDGCHHEKICMDCGYREEEDCCFSLPVEHDGGENGGGDSNGGRCCWCGNMEKPGTEAGVEDGDAKGGDNNADTGAGDDDTDAETGNENMDAGPGIEETTDPEAEEESPDGRTEDESQNTETEEEIPETEREKEETGQADQAMTTDVSGDKETGVYVENENRTAE